jgi:hypothetical protein
MDYLAVNSIDAYCKKVEEQVELSFTKTGNRQAWALDRLLQGYWRRRPGFSWNTQAAGNTASRKKTATKKRKK